MKHSAGIIPYRKNTEYDCIEFFVGHPGGPFWKNKDYWAMFKGGIEKGESPKDAAMREFSEETGVDYEWVKSKEDKLVYLGQIVQGKKKTIDAFALCMDDDEFVVKNGFHSNLVPDKGWPEVDMFAWLKHNEIYMRTHKDNLEFYDKIVWLTINPEKIFNGVQ